jgi:hypothetical protein
VNNFHWSQVFTIAMFVNMYMYMTDAFIIKVWNWQGCKYVTRSIISVIYKCLICFHMWLCPLYPSFIKVITERHMSGRCKYACLVCRKPWIYVNDLPGICDCVPWQNRLHFTWISILIVDKGLGGGCWWKGPVCLPELLLKFFTTHVVFAQVNVKIRMFLHSPWGCMDQ